jgi:glutamyl-tRNA reductase
VSATELSILTLAPPGVPAARRAAFHLDDARLVAAHRRLADAGLAGFVLCTCLRVEVAAGVDSDRIREVARLALDTAPPDGGRVRSGEEAVLHLFRLAAGADSALVGESEVLAQYRRAAEVARGEGSLVGELDAVVAAGVAAGRAARRRFSVSARRGSLAAAAVELVGSSRRVAVVGGGAMAGWVLASLRTRRPAPEITVYVRHAAPERTGGSTRSLDHLSEALAAADAVVSATSATSPLLSAAETSPVLAARRSPLLLVDLGMPPNLPLPGDGWPVRYVGVDELSELARTPVPAGMDDFLRAQASKLWARLVARPAAPVIAAILRQIDEAVVEEVARFAPRLETTADREAVLVQLATTVARRVLHRPLSSLGSGAAPPEVLANVFGVDDGD